MDEKEHVISEELLESLQAAISRNQCWIAYNTMSYFLESGEVYFFSKKDEAEEFAMNNISDRDCFDVIRVSSVEDVFRHISYGKTLDNYLHQPTPANLITNKNSVMNEKNYEYLTDQLLRSGFGDTLNEELRKNIEQKNGEFTLALQNSYGTDNVNATLHFKRSDESDMVFFNKYDLELKKENSEDALKQTFYPNKNITLKEGYNLLDGRAVHKTLTNKEGEKYQAWLQLDFKDTTDSGNFRIKQFHHNYGFNLEQTLCKYPIKELQNEQYKESLIRSLERGNLQSATFVLNGKEEKIFLTPNVEFKALSAFDASMNKIRLSELMQSQKQGQSVKPDAEQTVTEKQTPKKENTVNGKKEKAAQKKKQEAESSVKD